MIYGYVRYNVDDNENKNQQETLLKEAGVNKIFYDVGSGETSVQNRYQLFESEPSRFANCGKPGSRAPKMASAVSGTANKRKRRSASARSAT